MPVSATSSAGAVAVSSTNLPAPTTPAGRGQSVNASIATQQSALFSAINAGDLTLGDVNSLQSQITAIQKQFAAAAVGGTLSADQTASLQSQISQLATQIGTLSSQGQTVQSFSKHLAAQRDQIQSLLDNGDVSDGEASTLVKEAQLEEATFEKVRAAGPITDSRATTLNALLTSVDRSLGLTWNQPTPTPGGQATNTTSPITTLSGQPIATGALQGAGTLPSGNTRLANSTGIQAQYVSSALGRPRYAGLADAGISNSSPYAGYLQALSASAAISGAVYSLSS